MEESELLPLKRVELSLSKLNEVVIPYHLDLLRQHRANILKHEAAGEYALVLSEQRGGARVAARLRGVLRDVHVLRARVLPADRELFDARTRVARDKVLDAVQEYLGMIENSSRGLAMPRRRLSETSPLAVNRMTGECVSASALSTDSVGLVAHGVHLQGDSHGVHLQGDSHGVHLQGDSQGMHLQGDSQGVHLQGHSQDSAEELAQAQAQLEREEEAALGRERALAGWSEVQREVHALHAVWSALHACAREDAARVHASAGHVQRADHNVRAGRRNLALAENLRTGAYCVTGALGGAALAGPLGLLAGAKAGLAAALAGSLLGYFGVSALGKKNLQSATIDNAIPNIEQKSIDDDTTAQTIDKRKDD